MNNLIPRPLRVVDFYEDGLDSLHFEFQILDHKSHNSLKDKPTKIKSGQFFMLSVPGIGEAPFTYVNKPDEHGHFYSLIRKTGTLTESLWYVKRDDILGYRGPLGIGWPILSNPSDLPEDKNILVIAGGCGLAPLVSWLNKQLVNSSNSIALLYGSKNKASQVLNKELLEFKKHFPVFEVFDDMEMDCIQGNPLSQLDHVLHLWDKKIHHALICGPEMMMYKMAGELMKLGMSNTDIWLSLERRMHCGVGTCGHCYVAHNYICKDGPVYQWSVLSQLLKQTAYTTEVSTNSLRGSHV